MPTLTPEIAGAGLIGSFIAMGVALIFQVYMLYLNWKQSKVKNDSKMMIELLTEIRDTLKNKKKVK